jgi:hypothetical protein
VLRGEGDADGDRGASTRSGDSRHPCGGRGSWVAVLWPAEVVPAGAGKAGANALSACAVGGGVDDLELDLAAGVGEAADRARMWRSRCGLSDQRTPALESCLDRVVHTSEALAARTRMRVSAPAA